jgi:predicted ATPase
MSDTISYPLIGYRYELWEPLGQGGMGRVYRAKDRLTGEVVALKQVSLALPGSSVTSSDQAQAQVALAHEFHTLASLRHPHIISVLDYGFDAERQPYLAMTLLERPLDIRQAAEQQDEAGKVELLRQLLQALAYLHRRGVIHRDLKPANVLVDEQGQVKVLDFGLAIRREREATAPAGTLAYMAPELLQEQPASPAADLYAVGVIAFELLTGSHPFDSSDSSSLAMKILLGTPDIALLPANLQWVVSRLLSREPAARYQNAVEVIHDLSSASGLVLPAESASIRESFLQAARFVGREQEMGQLSAALSAAMAGQGSAWLVGGESGVGKSRLLEELRAMALVEGMMVVRGQSVAGGGLPYQLWREIARRLLLSAEPDELDASVLQEVVPDIERLLGRPIPPAPPLDGKSARYRLTRALANLLSQQKQPVLLLVEDLHWARASLEPLQRITRLAAELPLMIVGTYRDDERPGLAAELPAMQLIKLERLNPAETAALGESMLGEAARQPAVRDLLHRETEGNALFLVEVVRALAEEAGRLSDIGRVSLPERVMAGGIQKIIQRRLARVPAWGQPLLKAAAVTGRQLELPILQRMGNGAMAAGDLEGWLLACANAAVLEVQEGQWRFSHDKLREALLDELEPAESASLHRQAAEAIEQQYGDDLAYAAVLANHWQAAGDPVKEAYYAMLAGEQALMRNFFQDAANRLERALALTPAEAATQQARILLALGKAQERLTRYPQAIASLEAALAIGVNDLSVQAEIYNYLSLVQMRQDRYEEALASVQEALRLAQAAGDQKRIGGCFSHLGDLAWTMGQWPAALRYYEEAIAIGRELDNPHLLAISLNGLGVLKAQTGEFAGARHDLEESLALDRVTGNLWGGSVTLINLGELAYEMGDDESARRYTEEGIAVQREFGGRSADALANLGRIVTRQGDVAAACRYYLEAIAQAQSVNVPSLVLKTIAAAAGLRAQLGEAEAGAEWLGLALAHPAYNANVQLTAGPIQAQLAALLPAETVAAALARGKGMSLETAVDQVQSWLTTTGS